MDAFERRRTISEAASERRRLGCDDGHDWGIAGTSTGESLAVVCKNCGRTGGDVTTGR